MKATDFKQSIMTIARVLSSQYGIKVYFKGDQAKTSGKVIILPALPDEIDEDTQRQINGYLDHEVAHVLFSEFRRWPYKKPKQLYHSAFNILDDVYIERKIKNLWRGSAANLVWLREKKFDEELDAWTDDNSNPRLLWSKLLMGMFFYAYNLVNDDHPLRYWGAFQELEPELTELIEKHAGILDPLLDLEYAPVKEVRDQEKLFKMAEKFVDAMIDELQQTPLDEKLDEEKDEDGSSFEEEQKTKKNKESESKKKLLVELCDNLILEKIDEQVSKVFQVIYDVVKNVQKALVEDPNAYAIFTTEGDTFKKVTGSPSAKFQDWLNKAHADVGMVYNTLMRSLLSTREIKELPNQRRGRVDRRSLARIGLENHGIYDGRYFSTFEESPSFDTVVMLTIDLSGSMGWESRLKIASETALILGESLHRLQIPFEILGHTTGEYTTGLNRYLTETGQTQSDFWVNPAGKGVKTAYTRWGDLRILLFKEFSDLWTNARYSLFDFWNTHSGQNSFDGEVLDYVLFKILSRPEKRKIIFEIKDGQPQPNLSIFVDNHWNYLKRVIAKVKENGVELVGFGIKADVSHFYENALLISDVEKLPAEVISVLSKLLKPALKR